MGEIINKPMANDSIPTDKSQEPAVQASSISTRSDAEIYRAAVQKQNSGAAEKSLPCMTITGDRHTAVYWDNARQRELAGQIDGVKTECDGKRVLVPSVSADNKVWATHLAFFVMDKVDELHRQDPTKPLREFDEMIGGQEANFKLWQMGSNGGLVGL